MLVESRILHLVEEKVPFSFVLLEKQCNQWFHLEVKNNENWKFIIESEIICRQLWLDHFTSFNTDFALCSSQSICWQQTNQLKFRFISLEINMMFPLDCFVCVKSINSSLTSQNEVSILSCLQFHPFLSLARSLQFDIQFNKFYFLHCKANPCWWWWGKQKHNGEIHLKFRKIGVKWLYLYMLVCIVELGDSLHCCFAVGSVCKSHRTMLSLRRNEAIFRHMIVLFIALRECSQWLFLPLCCLVIRCRCCFALFCFVLCKQWLYAVIWWWSLICTLRRIHCQMKTPLTEK